MVKTYWAIGIYFGKDEKTMPVNGLPAARKCYFDGLSAGIPAGWNDTLRQGHKRLLAKRVLCVNPPLSLLCDNTGVAGSSCLQHLGTSGYRFKWLLRCKTYVQGPTFLTPSAFDWRVAFTQGAQQADPKRHAAPHHDI
jgi:hypothetical protein